jgi:hypothetical protein
MVPARFSSLKVGVMMNFSNRKGFALALTAGAIGVGCVVACSSSSGGGNSGTGGDSGVSTQPSGDGGVVTTADCPNPTLSISFSPMYSAFIPGSTAQTFAIPVVTNDGNTATWSLSDPTQGNIQQPEQFTAGGLDGLTLNGAMITINGTGGATAPETVGSVIVIAKEGTACGTAVLNITQNTEDDWTIGNARYNDGVILSLGGPPGGGDGGGFTIPDGGFGEGGFPHHDGGGGGFHQADGGSFFEVDGGTACSNCHGATAIANNVPFHDVEHTPEQTGGFSDSDLADIIIRGTVPDGGFWDPAVFTTLADGGNSCPDAGTTLSPDMPACALRAYAAWQQIHQWNDITDAQLPGVIAYLRALTPAAQTGTSNFGGGGGGGGHHHDGGGAPPVVDAGAPTTDDAGQ